jgi:hypothetical protein
MTLETGLWLVVGLLLVVLVLGRPIQKRWALTRRRKALAKERKQQLGALAKDWNEGSRQMNDELARKYRDRPPA